MDSESPLLHHPLGEKSALTAKVAVDAIRADRQLPSTGIPPVCVLEFDGDLTDWLVRTGRARRSQTWACFHTVMEEVEFDGMTAGVVARTIGGPYAVLVAEQMLVSGAEVVIGLTSAGRVSNIAPLPSLVVATSALRDEGTSLHYLPPSRYVQAPADVAEALERELAGGELQVVKGPVWTTDAPYRETRTQMENHAEEGIVAVDMQAASLFALAAVRNARIGIVGLMTNAMDHAGPDFEKGGPCLSFDILQRIVKAGYSLVSQSGAPLPALKSG